MDPKQGSWMLNVLRMFYEKRLWWIKYISTNCVYSYHGSSNIICAENIRLADSEYQAADSEYEAWSSGSTAELSPVPGINVAWQSYNTSSVFNTVY